MTEAFVIRSTPWREHDRLIVLYSRQLGKCSVIAKGAQRATSKQSLALDSGTLLQCDLVPGRAQWAIATGAQALSSWPVTKADPLRWAVAQFFLEAIHAVVFDDQPDDAVWAVLGNVFGSLEGGESALGVFRSGQQELLVALGYGHHAVRAGSRGRTPLDERFEYIAQRPFSSLSLVYRLARW